MELLGFLWCLYTSHFLVVQVRIGVQSGPLFFVWGRRVPTGVAEVGPVFGIARGASGSSQHVRECAQDQLWNRHLDALSR